MRPTTEPSRPRAVDHDPGLADKLLRSYDRDVRRLFPLLAERFGRDRAEQLNARIREAFAASIPRLPYIGGRSNPLTENLHGAARFIAMWRVLRDEGFTPEFVGGLFSDLYTAMLSAHSPRVMHLLGRFHASRISRWMQRHQADRSQHHAHPGDWVFTAIEGDGQAFDYGIDYHECGIAKLLAAEGVPEIGPWLCALDYPLSKALGLGLRRTETLLTGGTRCDFRFKRGRPEVDADGD
jgi:plasmid stabilization system protein ParE